MGFVPRPAEECWTALRWWSPGARSPGRCSSYAAPPGFSEWVAMARTNDRLDPPRQDGRWLALADKPISSR